MITRLKNILGSSKHRILLTNFSYLSLLEIFSLLFPLLSYPYLIRVLGKDVYGAVVFVQSAVAYLIIVVNFGFNVSATKTVSENRNNIDKLSEVFSSILTLKVGIFLIASFVYCIWVFFCIIDYKLLYFLSLGLCLQEILFPVWFFQGVEQMKYITYVSFTARFIFLSCIFLIVRRIEDYYWIPVINSLGGLLSSVISIYIIYKRFGVRFYKVRFHKLRLYFVESVPFFASRGAAVVLERTNTIIIGNVLGFGMVASYDLALKVVNILKTPFALTAQVLYPNVANTKNMLLVKKTLYLTLVIGVIFSLLLVAFSKYIVLILGGDKMLDAVSILMILSIYMPIIGASYILGASTLVVSGHIREYNLSVLYSFIIYLIVIAFLFLIGKITLSSMAFSYILPEFFIAAYRYFVSCKYKLFK